VNLPKIEKMRLYASHRLCLRNQDVSKWANDKISRVDTATVEQLPQMENRSFQ